MLGGRSSPVVQRSFRSPLRSAGRRCSFRRSCTRQGRRTCASGSKWFQARFRCPLCRCIRCGGRSALRGCPAQLDAQRGRLPVSGLWFRHDMHGCPLCGYRHGGKVGGLCTAYQAKGRRGRRVRRLVREWQGRRRSQGLYRRKGFPPQGRQPLFLRPCPRFRLSSHRRRCTPCGLPCSLPCASCPALQGRRLCPFSVGLMRGCIRCRIRFHGRRRSCVAGQYTCSKQSMQRRLQGRSIPVCCPCRLQGRFHSCA